MIHLFNQREDKRQTKTTHAAGTGLVFKKTRFFTTN